MNNSINDITVHDAFKKYTYIYFGEYKSYDQYVETYANTIKNNWYHMKMKIPILLFVIILNIYMIRFLQMIPMKYTKTFNLSLLQSLLTFNSLQFDLRFDIRFDPKSKKKYKCYE